MSFDNNWPKRKDHRKPYYRAKVWDRTCRNHGSCGYCTGSRLHSSKRREPIVLEPCNKEDFMLEMDQLDRYSSYLLGFDVAKCGDWFYYF